MTAMNNQQEHAMTVMEAAHPILLPDETSTAVAFHEERLVNNSCFGQGQFNWKQ
jgi:hypothetical protein